jgi:hypothetical protein
VTGISPTMRRQATGLLNLTSSSLSGGWSREPSSTGIPQMVIHPDTNHAQRCLTSVIRGELVHSTCYRRWFTRYLLRVCGPLKRSPQKLLFGLLGSSLGLWCCRSCFTFSKRRHSLLLHLCPHIVDTAPSIDDVNLCCRGSVRFQSTSIDSAEYV